MAGSFGKPTMSALVANIKRPDGACSGRVEIKGVRGARETSRTQGSVFKDSGEAHSPECWGGAGRRAQSLTLDPRGPTPQPEGPQVGPDTLARDMLDVIIFIHFLFLKIRVNIQYIVSLSILYIIYRYCRAQKITLNHLEAAFDADTGGKGKKGP